jgi:hypothetical protein
MIPETRPQLLDRAAIARKEGRGSAAPPREAIIGRAASSG